MNTFDEVEIWKSEIEAIKQRVALVSADPASLTAFYGSSSIRLWDTLQEDVHPHQAINLGFGGSSYFWCNYYFEEVFQGLFPSRVILYAGDNDLGTGTPYEEIMNSFSRLVNKVKSHHQETSIAVIGVKASPDRVFLRNKIEHLNESLKALIHEVGEDYIDVYTKMLNPDGSYRPELFTDDMLHMNEKGYEIWKHEVRSYLSGKTT